LGKEYGGKCETIGNNIGDTREFWEQCKKTFDKEYWINFKEHMLRTHGNFDNNIGNM
jgi:hypothetical protein